MKTVQVSRRSASYRRRLLAAGALSAVVALSYVDSAFAVDCPPNSSNGGASTGTTLADCDCDVGYAPDGSNGCQDCPTGTQLITVLAVTESAQATCGGIAPGYTGTSEADDDTTATAKPCAGTDGTYTSATQSHVTSDGTKNAEDTVDVSNCKTKPGYYLSTVYSNSDDSSTVTDIVPEKSYGAGNTALIATSDDTVVECPTATTTSAAGASAVSDCNIIVCEDIPLNGATDATTGGAVQTPDTQNDGSATFNICESAPGYYVYYVASGASNAAAGIRIEKAPANYYAPGGQDVISGPGYEVEATANMASSSNGLVTACPTNSNSRAGSSKLNDCECAANFYPSNYACVACASGTTRAGTVSVTGTATCSAAASPTAAESAGACTPIAVALATAAAVPLLL